MTNRQLQSASSYRAYLDIGASTLKDKHHYSWTQPLRWRPLVVPEGPWPTYYCNLGETSMNEEHSGMAPMLSRLSSADIVRRKSMADVL